MNKIVSIQLYNINSTVYISKRKHTCFEQTYLIKWRKLFASDMIVFLMMSSEGNTNRSLLPAVQRHQGQKSLINVYKYIVTY